MNKLPILVIGKNGKTGSRVNERLQVLGYASRPVSRSTNSSFDWEKPEMVNSGFWTADTQKEPK